MPSARDDVLTRVSASIERDTQTIQDFVVKLLRISAVNPRMGGPGEAERAQFLEGFLRERGLSVTRVDVRDDECQGGVRPNLSAKLDGADPDRNLWLISHMDTVPEGSRDLWDSDPFEPVVKDGKVIARGAEDNGQSLVSSLFALLALKSLGVSLPFNVGVWMVSDEEFGSNYGVRRLLEGSNFRKDDLVVVPDSGTPKGADIEIAEKSLLWMKVTTRGKQVHASLPRKGLNANRVGMKLALELDEMLNRKYRKRDSLFEYPVSSFEPTKREKNVDNVNTIPGLDTFYFDCRVLPVYDLDRVVRDVKAKIREFEKEYRAEISFEEVEKGPAGPATSEDSPIAQLVAGAVSRVAGKRPRFVGIGGQTVGNLFRRKGIPTAVWSTIDEVAHEPNEYCRVANLVSDAKVFASLPLLAIPRA